mgnify:CR=1 FL=1
MKKYDEQKIEEAFKELLEYINLIENKELANIAKAILMDNKESFCNRSAMPDYFNEGIYEEGTHHFFKGGLLYHSLAVTKLSLEIAKLYNSKFKKLVLKQQEFYLSELDRLYDAIREKGNQLHVSDEVFEIYLEFISDFNSLLNENINMLKSDSINKLKK